MATTPANKPTFDIYTGMMLGSVLALAIAIGLLAAELNRYGGLMNGYPWWKTPNQAAGS